MLTLSSIQNPTVKALRELKTAAGRRAGGLLLIEGEKLLGEALAAGQPIVTALVDQSGVEAYQGLIARLEGAGARVYSVPEKVIDAVSDTRTPQGILAAMRVPEALDLDGILRAASGIAPGVASGDFVGATPGNTLSASAGDLSNAKPCNAPTLLIALEGVQDPGNLGAIWRTADAVGAGGMLLSSDCADPFSPKVVRASMGALLRVPVMRCDNLPGAMRALSAEGYDILASALSGEDFFTYDPSGRRQVLVIGSEARGVSGGMMDAATHILKLPMLGGAESLNAAVAAGIMMYQLSRGHA